MLQKSQSFDSGYRRHAIITNPFYTDLSNIMNDGCFLEINRKYLKTWSDIEVFILYMKLYEVIKTMTIAQSRSDILSVIHVLMSHTESRKQLIGLFERFKSEEESFEEVLKQFMQDKAVFLAESSSSLLPSSDAKHEQQHALSWKPI